ncbi:MAG: VWA domain-containing protein [Clostridia bacterium]|nr:VWA domain-containing protein [Clostridia bacterium]
MTSKITELVFILDRSGSMSGLESDTIGGFNAMLQKQKAEAGTAYVTTVLFDDKYELLHDRIDIRGVAELTDEEYFVRGSTALYDAVGKTVQKLRNVLKHTAVEQRADKVLIVITTDGMENSSREYSAAKIKTLIETQRKAGWEFLFLGANIDAAAAAEEIGIAKDRSIQYLADSEGTVLNYEVLTKTVSQFRSNGVINEDWKDDIEKDFQKRGKRS